MGARGDIDAQWEDLISVVEALPRAPKPAVSPPDDEPAAPEAQVKERPVLIEVGAAVDAPAPRESEQGIFGEIGEPVERPKRVKVKGVRKRPSVVVAAVPRPSKVGVPEPVYETRPRPDPDPDPELTPARSEPPARRVPTWGVAAAAVAIVAAVGVAVWGGGGDPEVQEAERPMAAVDADRAVMVAAVERDPPAKAEPVAKVAVARRKPAPKKASPADTGKAEVAAALPPRPDDADAAKAGRDEGDVDADADAEAEAEEAEAAEGVAPDEETGEVEVDADAAEVGDAAEPDVADEVAALPDAGEDEDEDEDADEEDDETEPSPTATAGRAALAVERLAKLDPEEMKDLPTPAFDPRANREAEGQVRGGEAAVEGDASQRCDRDDGAGGVSDGRWGEGAGGLPQGAGAGPAAAGVLDVQGGRGVAELRPAGVLAGRADPARRAEARRGRRQDGAGAGAAG